MKELDSFLSNNNYLLITKDKYWSIYTNSDICLIIDFGFPDNKEILDYGYYTKEQNSYMFSYNKCFRFYVENKSDFKEFVEYYNRYIDISNKTTYSDNQYITSRQSIADPTPLEAFFENAFEITYGKEFLSYLHREYEIIDINGRQRFFDYVLYTKQNVIAIEENGITYHHPQLIGKEKYKEQLIKQNSIVAQGVKLYRWSSHNLKFIDVVCDEIRKYFGDSSNFIEYNQFEKSRKITLYEHQKVTLKQLDDERKKGIKTFLLVLPTGTGKTKIVEEDLIRLNQFDKIKKVMIMVPSSALKYQWIEVLEKIFKHDEVGDSLNFRVFITTYAYMSSKYYSLPLNLFNYIVVDEAHHFSANLLSKIISHFNPETLIGLTATPNRYDGKRLEKIYGNYQEKISLKEAIKSGVLTKIRAFRLQSNLDLSEVRFNGKDYYSSDLERAIRVGSRNELIVKTVDKYFGDHTALSNKSGLIFCVNIAHAKLMSKLLNTYGISAEAVSGQEKNRYKYTEQYINGEIRFLCTCSLLTEGWDAPRTSIIVMARPTMSKVLYLQQLGRGTRNYIDKEALYVIDVVDNYGAFNKSWSIHGIFQNPYYLAFNDVLKDYKEQSDEIEIIEGLYEYERKLTEIDIFTFEQKYGNYLTVDQLARELFVSDGTVNSWIKKEQIKPDFTIPLGRRNLYFFDP